jgi:glycerophosphoryl diester phosphodiesterase
MTDAKPLLIAGATGYGRWPANSLEGALRCLALPNDGIEIDVQITADGHVVAHHDYRLSRDHARLDGAWLPEAGAPLKTLTLEQLQAYDIGRLRPGSPYALRYPEREEMDGVRIPTLRSLLQALKATPGAPRMIYVEIKTDPQNPDDAPAADAIVDAVFADLEAEAYLDHAKIIAFDWQVLRLSTDRLPTIKTAHLTIPASLSSKPATTGPSPWRDGYDSADHGGSDLAAIKAHGGMEWSPYFTDVTAETMAEARELGLLVGPWGLSAGDDIRRMAELGVYSSTVSGADWGD